MHATAVPWKEPPAGMANGKEGREGTNNQIDADHIM
jgi:hypothetical protein